MLSRVQLFVRLNTIPRPARPPPQHARLPCPSPSPSLLKLMSTELVMPSNCLILCHPLLFLPSIFPSIRVFSSESALLTSGSQSGRIILHPHQQCTRVPVSPHPYRHWLFSGFLTAAILVGVKWYLTGFDVCFPNDERY